MDMCKHAVNDDSGKNDQLVVPKCSVTGRDKSGPDNPVF